MSRGDDRAATRKRALELLDKLDEAPGVWRQAPPDSGIGSAPYFGARHIPDPALYEMYREGSHTGKGQLWIRRRPRPMGLVAHGHVFIGANPCMHCGLPSGPGTRFGDGT